MCYDITVTVFCSHLNYLPLHFAEQLSSFLQLSLQNFPEAFAVLSSESDESISEHDTLQKGNFLGRKQKIVGCIEEDGLQNLH